MLSDVDGASVNWLGKAAVTSGQVLQIMTGERLKEEWFDRSNGLAELQGRVTTAIEGDCWQQVVMVAFSSGVDWLWYDWWMAGCGLGRDL